MENPKKNIDAFAAKLDWINDDVKTDNARRTKSKLSFILKDIYDGYRQNGLCAEDMYEDIIPYRHIIEDSVKLDAQDHLATVKDKRQPSFAESIFATLERYTFLEQLSETFSDSSDTILVGGSMNYGPFFNVRSGDDSSDIDSIILFNDEHPPYIEWNSFLKSEIIQDKDKFQFMGRVALYEQLHMENKADAISHKFNSKKSDFHMSAHFFSKNTFARVFQDNFEIALDKNHDVAEIVRDFKPKPFEREYTDHYGLGGDRYVHDIDDQKEVEGGVIAKIPAYIIDNNKYYPGLYQSLMLPSPIELGNNEDSTTKQFKRIIDKRVAQEEIFTDNASIANTDPRRRIRPLIEHLQ